MRRERRLITLEQLERKVNDLECQIVQLQQALRPLRPLSQVEDTFGIFADDPDFDEVLRLGREYRDQANGEDNW